MQAFLEKGTVPAELIKAITNTEDGGCGLETIADFASAFTESTYEKALEDVGKKVKASVLGISRIRTAWLLARTELKRGCDNRSNISPEEDWDAPLSEEVETKRADDFKKAYDGLAFDTESMPSAALIGRLYREFTKRKVSIYPLRKVKSEADSKAASGKRQRKLADDITIQFGSEPTTTQDGECNSSLEVLWQLRLLTHGWVLAGTEVMEDPTSRTGKKTRMCHLTDAISYHDFVARKASEHPGPEALKVHWLMDRDCQTRSKARSLVFEGYPWGVALRIAKDTHCLVLWNVGIPGIPQRQLASGPERARSMSLPRKSGPKKPTKSGGKEGKATAGKDWRQQRKCPRFNGRKGCTARERDCPEKALHVCYKCGDWRHGAADCGKR